MRQIVVAGAARCLWDDLSRVPAAASMFGVNDSCMYLPRVDHMGSLHAEIIGHFAAIRRLLSTHDPRQPFTVHSREAAAGVDHTWPAFAGYGGTSSLFCARVALALGYDRVILAGVPLDASGHFYEAPGHADAVFTDTDTRTAWERATREFDGRVISCSGWTRELLGGL